MRPLDWKAVTLSLGTFGAITFALCVVYGLLVPRTLHMVQFLEIVLPGFGGSPARLEALGVEATEENRRLYRQMLFTTPRVSEFISSQRVVLEHVLLKPNMVLPGTQCLQQSSVPGVAEAPVRCRRRRSRPRT